MHGFERRRLGTDLLVALAEAAVKRAQFSPFRAIDRPTARVPKCRARNDCSQVLAGTFHMAMRARKVQLATTRKEVMLAFVVGCQGIVVRDFDIDRLAA